MQNILSYYWKEPRAASKYRAAVSLHSHTNRSKEGLSFIWEYTSRRPLLRHALATQEKKARHESSITVDFCKAYWTPPLSPLSAFELERDQIEQRLGIASMVSLTDHDNIEAPLSLRVLAETNLVPISFEWSVPFQNTTLHLGLHNLPNNRIEGLIAQFQEYTRNPREGQLPDLLQTLHSDPEALIVFNHPMWDLAGIGKQRHIQVVTDFVAKFGMYLHAFELGGLRSWEENQDVLEFAQKWNQLAIGGGDRHGTEPSAVLNLTNTKSFPEFVEEIRKKRRGHVLFMPRYAEPFVLRMLESLLDVIREYPDHPSGARRWDERVFHPDRNGVVRPLASLWQKPPAYIEMFFSSVRMLEIPAVRRAAALGMARPQQEMYFSIGKGQEGSSSWKQAYGSLFSRTRTTKSMALRTRVANLKRSRQSADSTS